MYRVGSLAVDRGDIVEIDRKKWIPRIHKEDGSTSWTYFEAGSGGKKTLMKVSYACMLHYVANMYGLQLPTFLIIDSPMKNISKEVDSEAYSKFYQLFYETISRHMPNRQFIVIDNDFVPPKDEKIDILPRYMTRKDPNHPPLISYYSGP